jgi:hypothetical protein
MKHASCVDAAARKKILTRLITSRVGKSRQRGWRDNKKNYRPEKNRWKSKHLKAIK